MKKIRRDQEKHFNSKVVTVIKANAFDKEIQQCYALFKNEDVTNVRVCQWCSGLFKPLIAPEVQIERVSTMNGFIDVLVTRLRTQNQNTLFNHRHFMPALFRQQVGATPGTTSSFLSTVVV